MLKRRRAIPAVANDNTTEKTKSCSVTRCLHTLLEELRSQPRAGPCSWIDKALRCVFFLAAKCAKRLLRQQFK